MKKVKLFEIIVALLIIAAIVFEIYITIVYGGKPVGEVPSWIHWWMTR